MCFCKLYADDLKLYTSLYSSDNASVLPSKLDELYCWSITWQLSISFKKCAIMYVSGTRNDDSSSRSGVSRPALCIGSNVIASVSEMKDMGVVVDNRLDFKSHVNNIVARAFVRSNLIHKCFISRDVHTLLRAFKTYVRPILEYASCIWSPHLLGNIKQIESVQPQFTKRLLGLANVSYEDRLALLHIDSLETRRLRFDLIMVYKILSNMVDVPASQRFTRGASSDHYTREHCHKLVLNYSRVDVRKFFFSERITKQWNALAAQPQDFSSLGSFKDLLGRTNLCELLTL